MASEIIIALITALASLLVAAFSLLTSYLTSRATRKSAQEIELFKDKLNRKGIAYKLNNEELKAHLIALKDGIKAIQELKDDIRLVVSSKVGSIPRGEVVQKLSNSRDSIISAYQEASALLQDKDDEYFHEAKNVAIFVNMMSNCEENANFIDGGTKTSLMEVHAQLSDLQSNLREVRLEKIINSAGISID